MNIEEIKELLRALTESDVSEIDYRNGKERIRIRRRGDAESDSSGPYIVLGHAAGATTPAAIEGPTSTGRRGQEAEDDPKDETAEEQAGKNLVTVSSPMVGTFYEASSPGSPPFVQVGDRVQPGQALCIIEAMKLMNEIEAETAGVVVKRFVANGQPVEYGEALFAIDPL